MQNYERANSLGTPCLTRAEMGPEIAERVRCARHWYQRHWQLLCNPDLTSRSKFELYKAFVRPILTYACELWDLSEFESKRLLRCESGILVEIYKSKYPQRHPKRLKPCLKSVYKRFRGTDVVHHVNCERLRWTDLLKHEERALRKIQERPPPTIRWYCTTCERAKKRAKQDSPVIISLSPSASETKEYNVQPKQSIIKKGFDNAPG